MESAGAGKSLYGFSMRTLWAFIIILTACEIGDCLFFLSRPHIGRDIRGRRGIPSVTTIHWFWLGFGLIFLSLLIVLLIATQIRGHPGWLAAVAVLITNGVIIGYSVIYYIYGTAENFGNSLSRTDAIYFTLTTLTTVGFGDIAPKSQAARRLVSSQMVVDLILLGVLLGIVVSRFSERRPQVS